MTNLATSSAVFENDEMKLMTMEEDWDAETLLAKEGIFFLKDIVKILNLDTVKVKKHAQELEKKGKNTWEVMGMRKIWNHWIVRMTVFGPYYRKHLISKVKQIPENMDGNDLLKQKGWYYLTDVCDHIPFSAHQIRYQANKTSDSREKFGVWKDTDLNSFVVDMELFSTWIKSLWDGNFTD